MANLLVVDGDSADKYLKTSGAGTDLDPHIPEHKETSAVAILAAVDGIEALETTGNASLVTITGHVDGIETMLTAIDGKLPALGQALAAASVPVILPAATVTTLTPPAAITGFATAAKQPALGTAGTASTDVITVQGIASGTAQPVSGTVTANQTARAAATTNVHVPSSNTAAVITYTAGGSGVSHVISGIAWSYSGAPTSGNLKVEDGSGTTVFSIDITAAGPGFIPFSAPLKGTANTAMIITLAAGGSGISGKVNALGKWTE